jgi:two-component system alkaline phosphatase synthesis response regulator PhoP
MRPRDALGECGSVSGARPRVLVADDEGPVLAFLEMKFSMAGFEVVTARDGREAWAKAAERAVDVIVTDYRMPDVDGVEFCTRLLMSPKTSRIPVLVITSPWCKTGDQLKQLHNVAGLVEKPFDMHDLVEKVRRLVGTPTSQGTPR